MHELDEDRADVIAFLKRTLQKKVDENAELMNRILALEQVKKLPFHRWVLKSSLNIYGKNQ